MLLIKKLGTFQRFGICFRVPYSNSNGSGCNATRQRPTGPTHKNPIWRPETGSSYISASNQDFFEFQRLGICFSTWTFSGHVRYIVRQRPTPENPIRRPKTDSFRIFRRHIGFFWCRALLYGIADVFAGMAVHVNIILLFGIAQISWL